jgi:hypothetical protein
VAALFPTAPPYEAAIAAVGALAQLANPRRVGPTSFDCGKDALAARRALGNGTPGQIDAIVQERWGKRQGNKPIRMALRAHRNHVWGGILAAHSYCVCSRENQPSRSGPHLASV